jgi:hypothetical protein
LINFWYLKKSRFTFFLSFFFLAQNEIAEACDWTAAMNNSNLPPLSSECDSLIVKMQSIVGNIK